jgi:AAA family ATP:ADP antiporter
VRRLLYLRDGELGRLLPFFALYLLASAAFTLADGLTLTLFVKRAGAHDLPLAYGGIAVANLLLIGLYVVFADRAGSARVFYLILGATAGVYLLAWTAVRFLNGGEGWFGAMFVGREIAFTLVLMHFGTFIQDYFTRDEMNRVLPLIYAGGRVGGIAGGAILQHLSGPLGVLDLVPVFVGLLAAVLVLLTVVVARCAPAHAPEDDHSDDGVAGADPAREAEARRSLRGFLRFAWSSPLLFWIGVTTVLFVVCRWALNFQYSAYFADHFADGVALAEFLGSYTQVALAVSLLVQVFLVNRLVAWVGLKGAHFLYTALLAAGLGLALWPMTLAAAVFGRLVEAELRFGLRNPVTQLLTNKFSKPLRIRVRAWTFGVLIPAATLAAAAALAGLTGAAVGWFGALAGAAHLGSAFGLYGSFRERPRPRTNRAARVG